MTAEFILNLQGQFEGVEVFGIENGRQRRTPHRSVIVHHLARNPFGIRNLLNQNNAIVTHLLSSLRVFSLIPLTGSGFQVIIRFFTSLRFVQNDFFSQLFYEATTMFKKVSLATFAAKSTLKASWLTA
jgi:hypothetical protein